MAHPAYMLTTVCRIVVMYVIPNAQASTTTTSSQSSPAGILLLTDQLNNLLSVTNNV